MRHARPAAAAVAVALLAGCGQPLFSAQLEVPELRITTAPQAFPDAALAVTTDFCSGVAGCLFANTQYDLGSEVPLMNEKGVTVDLRLTDVELHLTPQSGSLNGLQSVQVLLHDPVSATTTVIASYVRPPAAPPPTDIRVSGATNIDLGPYLSTGKLDARIEISYGSPPPGAFTAEVQTGFSVVVTVDYGALL